MVVFISYALLYFAFELIHEDDLTKLNTRMYIYFMINGIEPEVALDGTNNRFASRFNYVEKQVEASGKKWQNFTLNELDEFWNQAKDLERKNDL